MPKIPAKQDEIILVVGADGMIGRVLADHLTCAGIKVWETTHLPDTLSDRRVFLDMTRDVSGWEPPEPITAAVICAAMTSLERCQSHPEESHRFNVRNTLVVAEKLIADGVFLVFLSTSQVYDGSVAFRKANDAICPQTEYGRQKAEVEKRLLALGNLTSVIRFTKIIGPDNSLFNKWIQALQNRQPIHPFSDAVMSPLPLPFAVAVLDRVVKARLPGILQVSGKQDTTYEKVARYIAQRIGASQDLVQPSLSVESGLPRAFFPAHTTLDISRLRAELGLTPPDVWSTLNMMLAL